MSKYLAVLVAAVALAFPSEAAARRVRVHRGWHQQARAAAAAATPVQRVVAVQETSAESAIIEAGNRWGVLTVRTGQQHPALQEAAESHAAYMAQVGSQGHQGFEQRFHRLSYLGTLREVDAESWPGQDEAAAANEMFNSWRQSGGHWRSVNGRCRFWAYAMARARSGIWYGTGLFAD